jgi:hypothetical protein
MLFDERGELFLPPLFTYVLFAGPYTLVLFVDCDINFTHLETPYVLCRKFLIKLKPFNAYGMVVGRDNGFLGLGSFEQFVSVVSCIHGLTTATIVGLDPP